MSSSSSAVSSSYVNGRQLISGLSSGLDVDSIVQQTIAAQKWKLNKLQQQQQLATWRQTAYREIISQIQAFSNKYLDLTSSANLLSTKNLQQFATTSSNTAVITAQAGANAAAGSHKLTVSQLATAAARSSGSQLSKDVQGSGPADFGAVAGKRFIIDLDGAKTEIALDDSVTDFAALQAAVDKAVGTGKVSIAETDGVLTFKPVAGSGVQQITLSSPAEAGALTELGFGEGCTLTNRISTSDTLEAIAGRLNTALTFDADGLINLKINGVAFSFDKSATLDEVMTEINQSSAGATMAYNQLTGKLSLTADATGAGNTLEVAETDSSFLTAFLDSATAGTDAKLTLDGLDLTRSSNAVVVDGVTYTLHDLTAEAVTIGVSRDTEAVYAAISGFVEAYNALIESINGKLAETYDRAYPPLTDDQKAEMSEAEIEQWESKAKTGLLANDSLMKNLVSGMRTALNDSIAGVSTNLAKIGITTSTYTEKGKLHLDETKLRAAIEADPEGITNLFARNSASYPGTTAVRTLNSGERQVRYQEEGLAYRLYDIIQDNISTLRDSGGNKGLMVMKAGIENDTTDTENWYSRSITEYDKKIADEESRLDQEEERLYNKYSLLETYISTLSSQLSALAYLTED